MSIETRQDQHAVVLFDGVCNLCDRSVVFIVDRDPQGYFQFASLQSSLASRLLERFAYSSPSLDSILLIEKDRLYTRSTAALRIARHLRGAWPLLFAFIVIPAPLRDGVYRIIARNRYRWFGQMAACRIPTPQLRQRFLE